MRLLSLACALALGTAAFAAHAAAPAPATGVPGSEAIASKTLANGLKIIVWPDHDIPNANYYTFYRVGSRNEHAGITGLAHFFEHMMFNGTTRRAPGEFDRTMEAAGGSNNASTSNDLTIYTDWFPSSALETIFDLEGDRMANLSFDPKVVESERGVVYSERRSSVDNDNMGTLMEQMQATAYVAHPYQIPTIGWPSDIEHWKIEDLKQFYGGIVAVIGHEMTHGYDDQGSRFGPTGKFENWWTPADAEGFKSRTGKLVAQFDGYKASNGKNLNGNHTLGENIADLGGLATAYDALTKASAGQPDPKVDGLTRDQRFFYGWATVWRRNFTPEELEQRLQTDEHALAEYRAIGAPSNMPAFAQAFGCKAGDPMVREGDKQVVIW